MNKWKKFLCELGAFAVSSCDQLENSPIPEYFSNRCLTSLDADWAHSFLRCLRSTRLISWPVCSWLRCAPPRGSGIISSITPSDKSDGAVGFIASAAWGENDASRHKMDAHPSGE